MAKADEGEKLSVYKGRLDKLKALDRERRLLMAKVGAIDEEIARLLEGGVPIADMVRQVHTQFAETWAKRYPGHYVYTYTKDTPAAQRLLRYMTVEEIGQRATVYLRDSDPFYKQVRHSFGIFCQNINRFAPPTETVVEELELTHPPVGCTHVPQCRDDIEHTNKRNGEMRA